MNIVQYHPLQVASIKYRSHVPDLLVKYEENEQFTGKMEEI